MVSWYTYMHIQKINLTSEINVQINEMKEEPNQR
jgi:hypothetical protein